MLILHNLHTGFKETQTYLHQNIDLQIGKGKVTLLIGPNGVGKSVFLKTLCGLLPALGGTVEVDGLNIHQVDAEKRAMLCSIMLSTPPAIDLMSVQELVLSGRQRFLHQWRNPTAEDNLAVIDAMKKSNIDQYAQTNFGKLSDGIKQKTMLARCLAQKSQLILLDEPLAFLDYPSRKDFLELMMKIAETEQRNIVYSSHDLASSFQHCHHIIELDNQQFTFHESADSCTALLTT